MYFDVAFLFQVQSLSCVRKKIVRDLLKRALNWSKHASLCSEAITDFDFRTIEKINKAGSMRMRDLP